MSSLVTDLDTLQALVGKLPAPRDLKVIDYLDDHALRWLAASSFMFATFGDRNGISVTAGGGDAGFLRVADPRSLQLPLSSLDDDHLACEGHGFGSLFLVPGLDETLRINGRVRSVADGHIGIAVEECYLHCAKAFMRSGFWAAIPQADNIATTPPEYLQRCRFMALATIDQDGRADLSPKGDPAGTLLQLHEDAIWYSDRPGNRRVDSFRNILTQPRMAAMVLIPGAEKVMHITGIASVATDEAVRASFAVGDKTPKLVTRIQQAECHVRGSKALARARLWPTVRTTHDLDPVEIFKTHIKLSRVEGVAATLARASMSVPGVMRKGIEQDYKKNLY